MALAGRMHVADPMSASEKRPTLPERPGWAQSRHSLLLERRSGQGQAETIRRDFIMSALLREPDHGPLMVLAVRQQPLQRVTPAKQTKRCESHIAINRHGRARIHCRSRPVSVPGRLVV